MLRRYNIDPLKGPEVLVWAPMRVKGQHGTAALRHVVDQLKTVEATGGNRSDIVDMLKRLGKISASRR